MGGAGAGLSQSTRMRNGWRTQGLDLGWSAASAIRSRYLPHQHGLAKQSLSLRGGAATGLRGVSLRSILEGYAGGGDFIHVVFAGKVTVPCADGCTLRHRPLLRGLPARPDNAPYLLPATRGEHGFQMDIGAAACKAWADGVRIKLFHISHHTSFEAASQGLRLLIKGTRVKDAAEKYFFYRQGGAFLTFC